MLFISYKVGDNAGAEEVEMVAVVVAVGVRELEVVALGGGG